MTSVPALHTHGGYKEVAELNDIKLFNPLCHPETIHLIFPWQQLPFPSSLIQIRLILKVTLEDMWMDI